MDDDTRELIYLLVEILEFEYTQKIEAKGLGPCPDQCIASNLIRRGRAVLARADA